jgi:hypothetical protein
MEQQNYKTHRKLIVGHHGISGLAIIALIIGSIMNLISSTAQNLYAASLLVLMSLVMLFLWFFLRSFALKAQDRAIRAEESLRAFILTGKSINSNLTIRQIIGLRFAADEEYVALVERAVKENLSENDIKKQIKNWKPDTYRV